MIAGYGDFFGYGNTPMGGIKGLTGIFKGSKPLNNEKTLSGIDALVLWGGADIGSSLYKQPAYSKHAPHYHPSERDLVEWELMRRAHHRGIPIVGICRGLQIMCAFAGGKLVQDTSGHLNGTHKVKTYDDKEFSTSSCHHQMVYPYDIEHKVLATVVNNLSVRYEGINKEEEATIKEKLEPEVVYFPKIKGIGIQGHPEWHYGAEMNYNAWFEHQIETHLFKGK